MKGAPRLRRDLLRFAFSIVVSIALAYWLLRDLGLAAVLTTLRGAWLPGVAAGVAVFTLMLALRVVRYRVLLHETVPWGSLTLITLVRGMLADLLPARLGTLSYVWLITTRAGVRLDDALSSFFLAFVLDMVAIAPLLLLALGIVGLGLEATSSLTLAAAVLLAISTSTLLLLAPGLRLAAALAGRLHAGIGSILVQTAERVDEARGRGVLLPALAISFLIRVTKFGAYVLILQAALVPLGVAWGSLGALEAFLGIAAAEMSAMLPISGIAAIGTWEAAFAFGSGHLGLARDQAVLAGFATHVITQIHDYGLGLLALLILMRPRRR